MEFGDRKVEFRVKRAEFRDRRAKGEDWKAAPHGEYYTLESVKTDLAGFFGEFSQSQLSPLLHEKQQCGFVYQIF